MARKMCISDLIVYLEAVKEEHGDLPVSVYSTERRQDMPMVRESINLVRGKPIFGWKAAPVKSLSISAILPWLAERIKD